MEKTLRTLRSECELCCRLKNWILVQRSWLGITVAEQRSEKAKRLLPDLERITTKEDLAVISDEGAVYLNDRAWIMVMYAMVEYRDWASRLTHPLLVPLARQAFAALSRNRHWLSKILSLENPEAIAGELRKIELEPCLAERRWTGIHDARVPAMTTATNQFQHGLTQRSHQR